MSLDEAVSKLLRETERLRQDVKVLNGRIMRAEWEPPERSEPPWKPGPPKDLAAALRTIKEARDAILGAERDINAARSTLTEIEKNEADRRTFTQYIIPSPKR